MTTTEKAKAVHPMIVLREHFESRAGELKNALPAHIPAERFIRVALTAVQLNPDLLACNRQSLWNACLKAASDGLLPDGRQGAIVPFKDRAQWMPMIQGLRIKARNSGDLLNWEAHPVYERDQFDYQLGDNPFVTHKPALERRGKIIAAYSIAWLKDGAKSREVMGIEEIEAIRKKSRGQSGPWNDPTFYPEMCRKTVARRHAKSLPLSTDLDDLIRRDDDLYDFKPTAAETAIQTRSTITNVVEALERFGASDDNPTAEQPEDSLTEGAEYDEAPELSAKEYDAYEKGREAKRDGHLRKAVPGEYRSVEMSHLAKLWWQGWDDEAENRPWSREQAKP